MGDRPDDWTWFRTQPVVVPLNVAELIEDDLPHPGLMGLDEALENFDKHFDAINNDADVDAWDHGIETITARYINEYRLYAERFSHRGPQPCRSDTWTVRRRARRGRYRPQQPLVGVDGDHQPR